MNNLFFQELFEQGDTLQSLFSFFSLAYFLLSIALLLISKWIRDILTPYRLEKVLTEDDNKAIAISFSGYFLAVGFIIANVVSAPEDPNGFVNHLPLLSDLITTIFWSVIGILLLNFSAFLNNHFILPRFSNRKEMLEDHNTGVGICVAASYLASAFIISTIVSAPSEGGSLLSDIALVIIYYFAAHLALTVFAILYRKTSNYDVNKLMEEKDSTAAGLSLGIHLLAIAIVCAHSLSASNSLLLFFATFINGSVLLLFVRMIFNRILFRKPNIAEEIEKDDNWGIALCEGVVAIGTALLINATFIG